MALTLADVLTSLAYRLGENSSPSDTNEKARRIRYINEGYRKAVGNMPYWFTEESTTFNSVADQEEYTTAGGFPTDYRDMIELRVNDIVYTAIPQSKVFGLYNQSQQIFNYGNLTTDKHYYVFDNTLHILPAPASNGTNNIEMKYYKYPTAVSADSDTFVIPDFYLEGLAAYAYARKNQVLGKRGSAADGFAEFSDMLKDLNAEHNRQQFYNKSSRPVHPSYLVD